MTEAEAADAIVEDIAEFSLDPTGYVRYAFPWGEGQLERPRAWQMDVAKVVGAHLQNPETRFQPCQIAIASGHGVGKAQCVKTIIPTPSGDRELGQIEPGDFVFGRDGQPTEVLAVKFNGVRPTYKVLFDDDSFVFADENHDWSVKGRQERRKKLDKWRVLSTKQILSLGVQRSNGPVTTCQWEIPTCAPVYGSLSTRYAYAIGVWIGDGGRGKAVYTKYDEEIAVKLILQGFDIRRSKGKYAGKNWHVVGLKPELSRLGLLDCYSYQRFLPNEVWSWSAECRMELLSGLLDTDGECNPRGSILYSTTSERLIDDIVRLARSLGFKAQRQPTTKHAYIGNERHRDCYRATFAIPRTARPFAIKRKAANLKDIQSRYTKRWIKAIERVDDTETVCIQVRAPDQLFLTKDYIVTHNSAFVGQMIMWALSTCVDTRIVVTANTEPQLRTKTFPEISKWAALAINADWFKMTATALYSTDDEHTRTWRTDAITWSENNTEAFAGLHNQGKRIVVIFDEASSISDKVWEVTEGALTDENTEIIWLVFGNPTRNSGRFRQCFSKYKHLWHTRQIDSSTVEGTNKVQIQKWVDTFGEDSDFVRVRVKGKFPRASSMQLIDSDIVHEAQKREPRYLPSNPLIMALDIARGGADNCVIRFRRGKDAQSYPVIEIPGALVKDSMLLVAKVVDVINLNKPDILFYDGTGVGGPVGDRIKQLGHKVMEVQFGAKSPNPKQANFRAYMWQAMKDWLHEGGAIDESQALETDLTSVEYAHNKADQLILESKETMKARGLASPDHGDALAMTFAYPVPEKDELEYTENVGQTIHEYDPFA